MNYGHLAALPGSPPAEQWVMWVVISLGVCGVLWAIGSRLFALYNFFAHAEDLDKLEKRVHSLETTIAHTANNGNLDALECRVCELEREIATFPSDDARQEKLGREFERLTQAIIELKDKDRRH